MRDLCLWCPGRESNPYGLFGPRDFLATMTFATCLWAFCSPDYIFTIYYYLGVSCIVSAPSCNAGLAQDCHRPYR